MPREVTDPNIRYDDPIRNSQITENLATWRSSPWTFFNRFIFINLFNTVEPTSCLKLGTYRLLLSGIASIKLNNTY